MLNELSIQSSKEPTHNCRMDGRRSAKGVFIFTLEREVRDAESEKHHRLRQVADLSATIEVSSFAFTPVVLSAFQCCGDSRAAFTLRIGLRACARPPSSAAALVRSARQRATSSSTRACSCILRSANELGRLHGPKWSKAAKSRHSSGHGNEGTVSSVWAMARSMWLRTRGAPWSSMALSTSYMDCYSSARTGSGTGSRTQRPL